VLGVSARRAPWTYYEYVIGRSWMVVGALVAACTGTDTDAPRERICVPGDDAAMYATLTAQRWGACGSNVGLCLALSADGSYHAVRGEGDYEITASGTWNFVARDAQSGLACLDDGSVIDFALTDQGLVWGLVGALPPRDALAATGTRDALPDLLPAPEFYALTRRRWAKTNDLDLYGIATSFALHRDGTFDAAFRGGECTIAGTFSLVATDQGFELNPRPQPNTCDTRSGGSQASLGASNEKPVIDGDILRLYAASYRDAEATSDEQSLSFTSYGGYSLRVDARWHGTLSEEALPWAFTMHNASTRVQTVTSLRVSITPIADSGNGFSPTGPEEIVVDRMLHEAVAPGGAYSRTEDVAVAASGLWLIEIDVSSFDEIQRYDNQRNYVFSR
jgi:hypothetical protein